MPRNAKKKVPKFKFKEIEIIRLANKPVSKVNSAR